MITVVLLDEADVVVAKWETEAFKVPDRSYIIDGVTWAVFSYISPTRQDEGVMRFEIRVMRQA